MKSLNEMVRVIQGLANTKHVDQWESNFIQSVYRQTSGGKDTSRLSEKQFEIVERIYNKHFAG